MRDAGRRRQRGVRGRSPPPDTPKILVFDIPNHVFDIQDQVFEQSDPQRSRMGFDHLSLDVWRSGKPTSTSKVVVIQLKVSNMIKKYIISTIYIYYVSTM